MAESEDNLITLLDESGEEFRFSVQEVIEIDDQSYFILREENEDGEEENEEEQEYLVFRVETVDGEDQLVPVDDEEELERVAAALEEDWDDSES